MGKVLYQEKTKPWPKRRSTGSQAFGRCYYFFAFTSRTGVFLLFTYICRSRFFSVHLQFGKDPFFFYYYFIFFLVTINEEQEFSCLLILMKTEKEPQCRFIVDARFQVSYTFRLIYAAVGIMQWWGVSYSNYTLNDAETKTKNHREGTENR